MTTTSNLISPWLAGFKKLLQTALRSSFVPSIRTERMTGHHFFNSRIQLPTTLLGTMIKWGPLLPRLSRKYANRDIVWRVLPNPISSARMPLMPWSWSFTRKFRPSSWYGCILHVGARIDGCFVTRMVWRSDCADLSIWASSSASVSLPFFPLLPPLPLPAAAATDPIEQKETYHVEHNTARRREWQSTQWKRRTC